MRIGISGLIVAAMCLWSSFSFAADTGAGSTIYSQHCSSCHGQDGRGEMPGMPDFTLGDGLFRSNYELLQTIRDGKRAMPAFKGILTDNEINDVIAYLRMYQ